MLQLGKVLNNSSLVKKIALIIPNNLWVTPYLSIYTRLFDDMGVDYDIISWNRNGREEYGIQFQCREKSRNQIVILWLYIRYAIFVKKKIKQNGYDKLVVFSPQVGLFLAPFLEKHYKEHYIFDYRDLSIEQKRISSKRFKRLLSNSYANVISSPGFKKYLPAGFNYTVSHNFNVEHVKKVLIEYIKPYTGEDTSVLTIGALRTDMNPEVMDALGNVSGYSLSFVGKGLSAGYLENYAGKRRYRNVVFTGFYRKEEEPRIYSQHAMVNIVYPLTASHISALSNRFYNSLIYKRPMIVTRGTIQGHYAEQYGVGLVIDNCDDLDTKILEYRKNLNFPQYAKQCNTLLELFLKENEVFETIVREFISC